MRATAVALLVAALAVYATAQQQQCVITAQEASRVDYSGVKAACHSGTNNFCDACTCSLVSAFAPLVVAKNVDTAGMTQAQAQAAITSCIGVVAGPMQRAGVDLMAMLSLQNCPRTTPSCLQS